MANIHHRFQNDGGEIAQDAMTNISIVNLSRNHFVISDVETHLKPIWDIPLSYAEPWRELGR